MVGVRSWVVDYMNVPTKSVCVCPQLDFHSNSNRELVGSETFNSFFNFHMMEVWR